MLGIACRIGLVHLTLQAAATLKQKAQKGNFDQMLQNCVPGDDGVPAELVEHRKNMRKSEAEGGPPVDESAASTECCGRMLS